MPLNKKTKMKPVQICKRTHMSCLTGEYFGGVYSISVIIMYGILKIWFYGISTIVGYLMPNLVYTYILNIYDL